MSKKAEQAIGLLREAINVRKQITELYKTYRSLRHRKHFCVLGTK